MNADTVVSTARETRMRLQSLEVIGALARVSDCVSLIASIKLRPSSPPFDLPVLAHTCESAMVHLADVLGAVSELHRDMMEIAQEIASTKGSE